MPYMRREYSEKFISLEDELESLDILHEFIEKSLLNLNNNIESISKQFKTQNKIDDYKLFTLYTVLTEERQLLQDYKNIVLQIIEVLELSEKQEIINKLLELRNRHVSIRYLKHLIFAIYNV
jgi:hypothetical protein